MLGLPTISESQAGGALANDAVIYHIASSSLRMTPSSAGTKLTSTLVLPVLTKAPRCITVWVRKSAVGDGAAYNGNQPRLIQKANVGLGQVSDVVLDTATNSANGAWQMLVGTTKAPTGDGTYDIVVDCDGTAGWVNVDDWVLIGHDPDYTPDDTIVFNGHDFTALEPDFGPPVGDDGFTVFTASEPSGQGSGHSGTGTRKIYVDPTLGNDSNTGTLASPRKTPSSGAALLRSGFPDWLLFKSGETSSIADGAIGFISGFGRSPTECLLISTYGTGARPVIKKSTMITATSGLARAALNTAVVGLDLYTSKRDPDSADYNAGAPGDVHIVDMSNRVTWLLFEDCKGRFGQISIQAGAGGIFGGTLKLRRNIVVDSYDTSSPPQGMFCSGVAYGLMEENLLDHNGWNEDIAGAEANIFAHNIYLPSTNGRWKVTGNITARASSHGMQVRCGGDVDDNLMVSNAIGIVAGAPPFQGVLPAGPDPRGTLVESNVITQGRDIGASARAYGINIASVNAVGDATVANSYVTTATGNIIAHEESVIGSGVGITTDALETGDIITGNIIFEWGSPILDSGTGSTITPNQIDQNGDNVEYSFPDPTRSVASYDLMIGGAGTLENFLSVCRARARGEWDERYSATRVNSYIRPGFAMANPDNRVRVRLTAIA